MPPLNKPQKLAIRKASSDAVTRIFLNSAGNFAHSRWLDSDNPYFIDCLGNLVLHTQSGISINESALSKYIATSAPLHCADGWSFLGRALDACSRGDDTTCIHLAYYAELRAAMSILATEGIGIFDDRHFVVTSINRCKPIGALRRDGRSNQRTHSIAWLAIEYWATLLRSANLLRQIIRPGGIAMGDWLDAFGAGSTSRAIATKWLQTWGLDLKRLSIGEDRDSRNQASYRPTRLAQTPYTNALERSIFIRNLWTYCEPIPDARFQVLDRHLLRLSLEGIYASLPRTIRGNYVDRIMRMLTMILGDVNLIDEWRQFLTRAVDPINPIMITEASKSARYGDHGHHFQVVARACLLLRVATGACAKLLRECSLGRDEMEFWWKPLGEERGLWQSGNDPSDFMDLWSDIDDAIVKVLQWEIDNSSLVPSNLAWRNDLEHEIAIMGECERIVLWGMGL
jgi:hypothetical protein